MTPRQPRKRQKPQAVLPKPPRQRGCLVFPEVKGKTVDAVELWLDSDNRVVTIWFQDRTCLHFDMEPELTVSSDFYNWKSGEQRLIKHWAPTQNTR